MIIDTHVHIDKLLFQMTEEMVIEAMKKYHINYAIVSNCACCEFDHNLNRIEEFKQVSQIDSLKEVLSFARTYPNMIGVEVWVKPLSERLDENLKKLIEENLDVICGMKLHPYHNQISINDERLDEYVDFASFHHLTFSVHTGGCELSMAKEVYKRALRSEKCNFIMVHMDLGTDNTEAIEYLKLPNVYGDTTWVSVESTLKAIEKFGSEKILFGSDMPIDGVDTYCCNKEGKRSLYQQYFNEFKEMVTQKDYQNIMYKNAIKLFRLENKI